MIVHQDNSPIGSAESTVITMDDTGTHNSPLSERFNEKREYFGLVAATYDRARPRYDRRSIECILGQAQARRWPLNSDPITIVDVGCGTGIFTRQLAEALGDSGVVHGVEPTESLRLVAEAASSPSNVRYIDGVAEHLCFERETVDVITAATSANWFDRPAFYAEARRVLRKTGVLALLMNKRLFAYNRFLFEYEIFLESIFPEYARGTHANALGSFCSVNYLHELRSDNNVEYADFFSWQWTQTVSPREFEELAVTNSVVQRAIEQHGENTIIARLRALINSHVDESGRLQIPFATELTVASFKTS
ncbi:methyltransferase domain-containing protein [Sinorhizobium medicae]|nr:methyltransferase domain-containing protein [Sinorhizobium medicae]